MLKTFNETVTETLDGVTAKLDIMIDFLETYEAMRVLIEEPMNDQTAHTAISPEVMWDICKDSLPEKTIPNRANAIRSCQQRLDDLLRKCRQPENPSGYVFKIPQRDPPGMGYTITASGESGV